MMGFSRQMSEGDIVGCHIQFEPVWYWIALGFLQKKVGCSAKLNIPENPMSCEKLFMLGAPFSNDNGLFCRNAFFGP